MTGPASDKEACHLAGARSVLIAVPPSPTEALLCEPALRALRAELPQARLTLLSPLADELSPLLPVDLAWPAWLPWSDGPSSKAEASTGDLTLRFSEELSRREFDAAVIFCRPGESPHALAYLCHFAGIPRRAGLSREFAGRVLTAQARPLPRRTHRIDHHLHILRAARVNVRGREVAITMPESALDLAGDLLRARGVVGEFYLLGADRTCPSGLGSWTVALAALRREAPELTGVVVGLPRDREAAEERFASPPATVPLVGLTTLPVLAALVRRAALVLASSGPLLQLSAAQAKPTLAVFSDQLNADQHRPRGWSARATRVVVEGGPSPSEQLEHEVTSLLRHIRG